MPGCKSIIIHCEDKNCKANFLRSGRFTDEQFRVSATEQGWALGSGEKMLEVCYCHQHAAEEIESARSKLSVDSVSSEPAQIIPKL